MPGSLLRALRGSGPVPATVWDIPCPTPTSGASLDTSYLSTVEIWAGRGLQKGRQHEQTLRGGREGLNLKGIHGLSSWVLPRRWPEHTAHMLFFIFVYVNVCRCAYICTHAAASRQPRALHGESSRDSLHLGNCTRQAGQKAPGIHLSVAPTLRLQVHILPHLTFRHRFREQNSCPDRLSHLSPATCVLLLNVLFLHFSVQTD